MSPLPKFDDRLLHDFIEKFYGYGNKKGDYWFVGMEEGGGNSFEDVAKRIQDWDRRGRSKLEDIVAYHAETGCPQKYFGQHPKLQPTWNRLIRIQLSAMGEDNINIDRVREYQKEHLGQYSSNNCLVELLPLPSPSTKDWLYSDCSQLSYLANRKVYINRQAPVRALHLKQLIHKYKPKAVIFYSMNPEYIRWWKVITDIEFKEEKIVTGKHNIFIAKNEYTVFAITLHPVARGITNEYFHQVGRRIKRYFTPTLEKIIRG